MFDFLKRKRYIQKPSRTRGWYQVTIQLSPNVPSVLTTIVRAYDLEEAKETALRMYPGSMFLAAQTYHKEVT